MTERPALAKEQQSEGPTYEERVASLAERFTANASPKSLAEIGEITSGLDAEWQEEGFKRASSYLDKDGGLTLVAKLEDKHDDQSADSGVRSKTEKTWRFLIDDQIINVTISPEWQSGDFALRSGRGVENIYDIPEDEEELSEDMQVLVDKLGRHVSKRWDQGRHTLGDNRVGLSSVKQEVRRREGSERLEPDIFEVSKPVRSQPGTLGYNADIDEAYRIERTATERAARVQEGLFTTARKLERLRQQAYRDSIKHSLKESAQREAEWQRRARSKRH